MRIAMLRKAATQNAKIAAIFPNSRTKPLISGGYEKRRNRDNGGGTKAKGSKKLTIEISKRPIIRKYGEILFPIMATIKLTYPATANILNTILLKFRLLLTR
jgi:hypothetical protein